MLFTVLHLFMMLSQASEERCCLKTHKQTNPLQNNYAASYILPLNTWPSKGHFKGVHVDILPLRWNHTSTAWTQNTAWKYRYKTAHQHLSLQTGNAVLTATGSHGENRSRASNPEGSEQEGKAASPRKKHLKTFFTMLGSKGKQGRAAASQEVSAPHQGLLSSLRNILSSLISKPIFQMKHFAALSRRAPPSAHSGRQLYGPCAPTWDRENPAVNHSCAAATTRSAQSHGKNKNQSC